MDNGGFVVEARADFGELIRDFRGGGCAEIRQAFAGWIFDVRHIRDLNYIGRARRAVPLRESEMRAKGWAGQAPPLQSSERLRLFGLGRRGGFGAGYQACEGGGIFDRDVG